MTKLADIVYILHGVRFDEDKAKVLDDMGFGRLAVEWREKALAADKAMVLRAALPDRITGVSVMEHAGAGENVRLSC